MGHKIFISYKYWDSNVYPLGWAPKYIVRNYVSKLEKYFGLTEDVYKGEHDDEDLSDLDDETIWSKLKDRIFDSTVTIIMISPGMRDFTKRDKSQWIPWEISYSLREETRKNRTSGTNSLVFVILPDISGKYVYADYMTHFDIIKSNIDNGYAEVVQWNSFMGNISYYNNRANQRKQMIPESRVVKSV